ncbi:C39 family peptidase [Nocardioides pacificus]
MSVTLGSRSRSRVRSLATGLAVAALAPMALLAPIPVAASSTASSGPEATTQRVARTSTSQVAYREWSTDAQLAQGRHRGVKVSDGRLVLDAATTRTRTRDGRTYRAGVWLSPWTRPGFGLTEMVASWKATTPKDSWIQVEARGRTASGARASWDTLARWNSGDRFLRRDTVSGQTDDNAKVNVDTWQVTAPEGLSSWQLRVTLMRRDGARSPLPSVDTVGAMVSRLGDLSRAATSAPGVARGITLPVPSYSQMVHRGHSPQWGSGGQAWCSPTSTSMVLGYYRKLPPAKTYRWVGSGHVHPFVDQAARQTYDYAYRGTGNWPFNTAYAATYTGAAFVTRLRDLSEAERFIAAGIPVVISVSFSSGQLTGAPISGTNGHLLVVVGFTESGDVVVNDPAAPNAAGVRRTYDRAQVERVWLGGSKGLAYVIRDAAHPLPARPAGVNRNW